MALQRGGACRFYSRTKPCPGGLSQTLFLLCRHPPPSHRAGPRGDHATAGARVEAGLDRRECRSFPWHPKPVLGSPDSNAVQLEGLPSSVL